MFFSSIFVPAGRGKILASKRIMDFGLRLCVQNKSKPWLLSTERELEQDGIERMKYKQEYLERHPFPGIKSNMATKIAWLKDVHCTYEEIQKEAFYSSVAPKAEDFGKDVLLEEAPDEIWVNFVMNMVHF